MTLVQNIGEERLEGELNACKGFIDIRTDRQSGEEAGVNADSTGVVGSSPSGAAGVARMSRAALGFGRGVNALEMKKKPCSYFAWRERAEEESRKRHVPVNADCPLCHSSTETVQHALVECSFAKAAWHRSIVDVGTGDATFSSWLLGIFARGHEVEMEEAAMVSWAILRARNYFVWQKKSWFASNIVTPARNMLDQYKFTQERKGLLLSPLNDGGRNCERWIAPVLNKTKVNVDGALFEQEGRFGVGCVARDHHGTLVEAFKKGKVGYVQPEIAEIIGIKEALSWIATHPLVSVVLETDSLMCAQVVQSKVFMASQFDLIVQDVRNLFLSLYFVELCFVKRSANKLTHCLARDSCFSTGCVLQLEDCSSEIRSIILSKFI
ncbi:uncharacterized protein LOC133033509 [Cannabis sativa]|uniref:uncharacterized protein LOC133033509 n=1 Tax=Cannabis sativa TaxID=3483 RepID=UPI0029CA01F2|nr:uncharacterized protein LOC133033509 [Cannabis sativa]